MLKKEDSLLVVVDVQGKLAHLMSEKEGLFRSLQTLIEGVRLLGLPILLTEQVPEKLGATIPEIEERLKAVEPIRKKTFSCLREPGFARALNRLDRRSVILCGIEAHVCVYQTAVDLLNRGFDVHVVCDAVSSRKAANKSLAIERMQRAGATLTSVEMLLFELIGIAEGDVFRDIIRLVR